MMRVIGVVVLCICEGCQKRACLSHWSHVLSMAQVIGISNSDVCVCDVVLDS